MKIEIFGTPREKHEKPLIFRLLTVGEDRLELVIVDAHGNRRSCGSILRITPEGLHLYPGVSRYFNLPLTADNCIERKGSH